MIEYVAAGAGPGIAAVIHAARLPQTPAHVAHRQPTVQVTLNNCCCAMCGANGHLAKDCKWPTR